MARILVVDDDPDIVEGIQLFLERAGHTVGVAHNRATGMALLGTFHPDLMILDVMMEEPDDGLAMAQDIRRQGNKIPILMLTSLGSVVGMTYGKDEEFAPVDEFHSKPIDGRTLVERVNALLKR